MEAPRENCEAVGTTDVIIVGAGVAGAALAYSLGKDGRRVRVIERDLNAPRRISGEGLMPGGYLKLIELGLEDCVEEIDAQPFQGLLLYKDGKDATLPFPHVAGKLFHNGRFVRRLRAKAASLHNVSLEQGTVTSMIEENGTIKGVYYKDKSGRLQTAYAPLTVVCDGCFSNLRRSLCNPKVDTPSHFVGFVLTNYKKDNIRAMPVRIMAAAPHPNPGAFMIGDAFNMRHAITGGGMTVALSDVVLLRDLLRPLHDLSDASAVCEYLDSFYTLRKPMSSTINTLANVLQKPGISFLGHGNVRCWPIVTSVSFPQTLAEWSRTPLGSIKCSFALYMV
ncbi:hypothetical protein V6N13_149659 [Hibiscus sabdariffa]